MREILRMILCETANFCLGLFGFLFIVSVGCCLRMIWERMVKFFEDRINAIIRFKTRRV